MELLKDCITDLNGLLKNESAMHHNQFNTDGFEWVDLNHRQESVICYKRKGKKKSDDLLILLNMTPVVRNDWQVEVIGKSYKEELFNSDAKKYWGTGNVYNPEIRCELVDKTQKRYHLTVNLPPLGGIILK
jgi:1,4-alpha-glucan branching enzyme